MKRKPAKYNKDKEVKAIARERLGSPPPARVLVERAKPTKIKHKKKTGTEDDSAA